jgi:hypothetical protein
MNKAGNCSKQIQTHCYPQTRLPTIGHIIAYSVLGFDSQSSNEGGKAFNRKVAWVTMQTVANQFLLSGCLCRSIYRGGERSHYNIINTPNHLLINRVRGQGVTWSITRSHYFTTVQCGADACPRRRVGLRSVAAAMLTNRNPRLWLSQTPRLRSLS